MGYFSNTKTLANVCCKRSIKSAQTIDKRAGEAMLRMLSAYRASIGSTGAIEEMSYL
jgi:hypothetical protein